MTTTSTTTSPLPIQGSGSVSMANAADPFMDFGPMPEADRNILVYMLTDPDARRIFSATWAAEAQRMVAQFRAVHDLRADDPAFVDLLTRLKQGCAEFSNRWQAHDIRDAAAGEKSLNHPDKGVQRIEYARFQSNDDRCLKLVIYTPV